jgi:hypothetical protein
MSLSIADCRGPLLPELREFFRKVYGPSHVLSSSDAFIRWQFGQTSTASCSVKIALLDGRIVASLGYIPTEVSLKSATVRGAWVVNWIVDPEQRRLGLGPMLMREVMRQFDITLNVGPGADARELLGRMRWTDFGELPRYVRVLNTAAASGLIGLQVECPPNVQTADRGVSVRRIERFTQSAGNLWNQFARSHVAGACRTPEYLNWRYVDHPVFEYRLFEASRNGVLTGFAVYRLEPVSEPCVTIGRIVELICIDGAGEALLQALVDDAKAQAVLLDFFCSLPGYRTLMHTAGFCDSSQPWVASVPTVFQPIDRRRTGIPFWVDLTKSNGADVDWYVTKGDADQDRPSHLQSVHSCDFTTSV